MWENWMSLKFNHWLVDENDEGFKTYPELQQLTDDRWYTKPPLYFYQKGIIGGRLVHPNE